jgi:3'-phosphoadenosine 5'-phosphosulfate sulfotransferase (PAPS reductase)/FAD synthetase
MTQIGQRTHDTADMLDVIHQLRDRNALFVINHSGGKDSQAMTAHLREFVPVDQILVIHAHLPEVVWEDAWDHVRATSNGLHSIKVEASKTFFEMATRRGMWPSPKYRQCTSDLKRGPIEKAIRTHLRNNPQYGGLVVNCMGLRAEESPRRSKAIPLKINERNSKAGREWWDWLPIHDWTVNQVWNGISQAGQNPHWVYAEGLSRFSCIFCIFSTETDQQISARLRPELYRRYVLKEKELKHTMNMQGRGMEEITGIPTLPDVIPRPDASAI